MNDQSDYQQLYLMDAKASVQERLPSGGRPLIFMTLLTLVVFLLWASIAEMDEITRGDGKVIPSSRVQAIQNLEGGIIADIQVREGQIVDKGQVLVEMDDTRFISSQDEQKASREALIARQSRLQAEVDETDFVLAEHQNEFTPEISLQEQKLFYSRKKEQEKRKSVLTEKLNQHQKQLEELQAKTSLLKRRQSLLQEEVAITRTLTTEGAVSRVELLRVERQVSDVDGEVLMSSKSMERIDALIQETKARFGEVELSFNNEAREELNATLAKLNALMATDSAIQDRVERTRVRSPVRGIVKSIMVNTLGGVVQPGMQLMDIVPLDDNLLIEARIRPEDIGFLHPGQKAVVRFTAYDFTVHGGLEGKLLHISADTITNDKGESFYLVIIETEKVNLGSTDDAKPVIPGMVATVDVMTGKKSLLTYLLKPVLRAKQLAFTER